jgi:pyruvate dehydrogenase E1 component
MGTWQRAPKEWGRLMTDTLDEAIMIDRSASSDLVTIERRVLWLATSIVHHANHVRPNPTGLKVGGHQASSASMVTLMTDLWFRRLRAEDRVSVKPHASPVLHALNYLLGMLDERYLTTLRELGGLQSYPSRTKDPDPVDYSTGSVGIGATATIWGALARRYARGLTPDAGEGRQYCLLGDAELDEGAIWEALLDPMVPSLGELVWIVDVNRQSLDRVVPHNDTERFASMFAAAGWQVLSVKFGRHLDTLFSEPGGDALQRRIVSMQNAEYQRLLRCDVAELRDRLPGDGPEAGAIARLIARLGDDALIRVIRDLGGHDFDAIAAAFEAIDDDRPTVILAYTIKGRGLPVEGHPQNHSSMLTRTQYAQFADELGESTDDPWRRFPVGSAERALCDAATQRLRRPLSAAAKTPQVPTDFGRTPSGIATTQAALGRTLMDLSRGAPDVSRRVVTVSPDVSSSTNLAGWVNKVGVWSPRARADWFADDRETLLHWREQPTGQHLELGIAEVNLVGLLGELGATWSRWSTPLFPIGVLYDPFIERALEPWSFGIYAGARSILVGTPSGVTLAPEGGAHQSIKTPSIGIEQPGCIAYEPAFAVEAEWALLASMAQLGHESGRSAYLRLSTRPVDQSLAQVPADPAGRERRRRHVVAGGYILRRAEHPAATIATMGAMVPESLNAAAALAELGIDVDVVCLTSPGLIFEAMRARDGLADSPAWIIDQLFPADRARPLVTVLDGHPHTLAFLSGIRDVRTRHLGVTGFGQSADLDDTYRHHGIDAEAQTRAVLDLIH